MRWFGNNGKDADSSGKFVERVLLQFAGKMSPKVADANSSVIPFAEFALVSAGVLACALVLLMYAELELLLLHRRLHLRNHPHTGILTATNSPSLYFNR